MDGPGAPSVVPSAKMQDQPAATGHIDAGARAHAGLTTQQRFDIERASEAAQQASPVGRLLDLLPRFGRSPATGAVPTADDDGECAVIAGRHLHGLAIAGGVTLSGLRTPIGRRRIDHLIVAPSGIYSVEDRPWRGQVSMTEEELYVDGRLRAGVPDDALRTSAAVQALLADELAPVGLSVSPVIALPGADAAWREWQVRGVIVVCGRGLSRMVRHRPGLMGSDTVVRLALAADRLLETD
ncbi:hypothetical protein BH23CHL7_BH23CHL7_17710 [soil metagenome]